MNNRKKVLVTGGAGLIGSHLCDALVEKGHLVTCVDNFITGRKENISHLAANKNFKFIKADVSEKATSYKLQATSYKYIFHLASPASPKRYQENPIATYKVNSFGTHYLLKLAREQKARFLFASTSEVYGDPELHPQPETYWGNVNPNGERSCYSEDSEALTEDGWKYFKDISLKDKIATLSPIDHKLEYNKPYEIIKEKYSGLMKHFGGYKIDFLVTPNHKMYARRKHKSGKYEFFQANTKMSWRFLKFKTDAIWNGKEKKSFHLPKVKHKFKNKIINKINMDDWLEFFGYYISEGCLYERVRKGKNKNYKIKSILIAQSKNNKQRWTKIDNCLKKMPFKANYSSHQWFIINKQLYAYLKKFGKARDKYIPKELKSLLKRQLKILFDALYLGDGSKSRNCYYTASKRLADDIQEICLKIGYSAKITITHHNKNRNPLYNVYIRGRQTLGRKYKSKKSFLEPRLGCNPKNKKYSGYVYCVNVPNHIIYVRRGGKAAWCGNCYDESKRFGEMVCKTFERKYRLDVRIARIFNTYGPRNDFEDGRVIPNFIIQALTNKPITVYGDGKQTRSFCYVSDLAEALMKLMFKPKLAGEIINLGNPEEFTILELSHKVKKLTKSNSEIVFSDIPPDDPSRRRPDITKAKNLLDWQPKINLEEGLPPTIEYFKNLLKNFHKPGLKPFCHPGA